MKHFRREIKKHGDMEAAETKKAVAADAEALCAEQAAGKTLNQSTAKSRLRRADSKHADAVKARGAASTAATKKARAQANLLDAEQKLERAQADERKRDGRRAERERQQAERRQRADERQRDSTIRELEMRAERLEARVAASAPERITVLFIAANPDPDNPREAPLSSAPRPEQERPPPRRAKASDGSIHRSASGDRVR